jgi:hypothetical protein
VIVEVIRWLATLSDYQDTCRPPLTLFLKWFRTFHSIIPLAIMMDCSDTEALAVELAYPEKKPNIIYCSWHCVKNWRKQLRDKVGSKQRSFQRIVS